MIQIKTAIHRCLVLLLVAVGLVLGGCDSPQTGSLNSNQPLPTATTAAPAAPTTPPATNLARLEGKATVELIVNGSAIRIELDGTNAPITAGNFVDLVKRGVYNKSIFHRVVKDPEPFVVQGGDPQSKDPKVPKAYWGTGNFVDPATNKPRYIPLEIKPKGASEPLYSSTFKTANISQPPLLRHTRGAVAMARSEMPDSASSQFYFALTELPFLDGSYAVFGYVTQGMEVVDKIQQGNSIESAKVVENNG